MPHLVQVQKKYKSKGLALIASHVQNEPQDKVVALCRAEGMNYMVTSFGRINGNTMSGLPQGFLFDWTGKCVAQGRPDAAFYQKLDQLMAQAPHFLTRGQDFKDSAVAKIAAKLKKNRDFGGLVEDLGKLEGAEASSLRASLVQHAERLFAEAKQLEETNALEARSAYTHLSKLYKGQEQGDAAKARLSTLKKDKAFQTELKAARILAKLEAAAGQIRTQYQPEHPANRKPYGILRAALKKLERSYPDAKATAQAREIAKQYKLR